MNIFMLMMGGTGTRFGSDRPKQYTIIHNRPLFSFITEKADTISSIDEVVVVSHADWLDYVQEWCEKTIENKPFSVVSGGESRSESIRNGLMSLEKKLAPTDVVMIHDATHPYLDAKAIEQLAEATKEYGAATIVSRICDTLYRMDLNGFLEKVEPRDLIKVGASPEALQFGILFPIYRDASSEELKSMSSAGAIAIAHNIPMKVIPTSLLNLKITYQADMDLFLKLVDSYFFPDQRIF